MSINPVQQKSLTLMPGCFILLLSQRLSLNFRLSIAGCENRKARGGEVPGPRAQGQGR